MRDSLSKSYFDTFKQEAEIQNEIFGSCEHREAVQAFFEKRQPKFDQISLATPTIIASNDALVVLGFIPTPQLVLSPFCSSM